MERRFELKLGEKVFARLTVSETGEAILSHDPKEYQLQMLPTVVPFDESGAELKIQHNLRGGKATVSFSDNTGAAQLSLVEDEEGFLNVRDTKGLARLRTILAGPGAVGNEPVTDGSLVLRLEPFVRPDRKVESG
jgi:hypothetical protein